MYITDLEQHKDVAREIIHSNLIDYFIGGWVQSLSGNDGWQMKLSIIINDLIFFSGKLAIFQEQLRKMKMLR